MKRVLRGGMFVLAMVMIITALKLFLPDVAVVVGAIAALVGLVAIFRPIPEIGLNSRIMAGALVLIVGPMGFLDPPADAVEESPATAAARQQAEEDRRAEEIRLRRERAIREREERLEAAARQRARDCGQDNAIAADVWSRTFVKRELKSPSSSSFPWSGKSEAIGDCVFRVVSYVEADNSFGAKLRTYYEAKLRYDPVADKWTLISLRFEE